MSDIHAVLFDVDGTLLDTSEYILQAFEHTAKTHTLSFGRNDAIETVGHPLRECYRILTNGSEDLLDALTKTHNEFQLTHESLSHPFPGVLETLHILSARGMLLGAVTNRRSGTVHETLDAAGISPLLSATVCFDDVERPKPDPMPVMRALSILGKTPDEAFMVGDSWMDIAAGKGAGVKTIFVTYGFHPEAPHEYVPDHVVSSFPEILALI